MKFHYLGFGFRADQFYPWFFFVALSLLAALFSVTPLPLLHVNQIFPPLALMVVFSWVILRPDICTLTTVAILGLFQDFLLDLPLGIHALFYLILVFSLRPIRHFIIARGFMHILGAFIIAALIHAAMTQILAYMYGHGSETFGVLMLRVILASLLFPAVFWLVMSLYRFVVINLKPR